MKVDKVLNELKSLSIEDLALVIQEASKIYYNQAPSVLFFDDGRTPKEPMWIEDAIEDSFVMLGAMGE